MLTKSKEINKDYGFIEYKNLNEVFIYYSEIKKGIIHHDLFHTTNNY